VIGLSGRFRSSLIIGGQGIRARKLRTFLSMISLFLGVLAVVVVQAGAEIGERAMMADVELTQGKDGTRQFYLNANEKVAPVAMETMRGQPGGTLVFTSNAIIGEPGVNPINPGGAPFDQPGGYGSMVCDQYGNCTGTDSGSDGTAPAGQAIELQLTAMTGDIRQFRPFRPSTGRWLDFGSAPSLSPRLVLNKEAAKGFAQYRVPAEMRLNGASHNPTPRIIGVVDDGSSTPAAYVRADELTNWLPRDKASDPNGGGLLVMLAPTATALEQTLIARLVAAGAAAHELQPQVVNARKDAAEQLALMRWIFLGLAGLVLLIGVAGILNVGLATVGERIEEFALRRAVGTPRSLLAGIVLAETLLTGLITAGAAIGASALALKVASMILGDSEPLLRDLTFPWQAGVAGIVAGLIAGVLGGLVPAIRAARIPIATVMRA
jgi:putative ABC transport system permease protein